VSNLTRAELNGRATTFGSAPAAPALLDLGARSVGELTGTFARRLRDFGGSLASDLCQLRTAFAGGLGQYRCALQPAAKPGRAPLHARLYVPVAAPGQSPASPSTTAAKPPSPGSQTPPARTGMSTGAKVAIVAVVAGGGAGAALAAAGGKKSTSP